MDAVMDVDREIARSIFTSLAGSIGNLSSYEYSKLKTDSDKIKFYELINKALWREHANFSLFSREDVNCVFKNIAPILKLIRFAKTSDQREMVIESHRVIFIDLISKTKVG